jgi:hypothetical protein
VPEEEEEQMTQTMFFSITGEFVTKTAREWLYEENRPYENVIDFLLSAMEGTELDNDTLLGFANDVLLGKRKFVGTTRDKSFGLVDDNTNIIKEYPCYFSNKPIEKYAVEEKDDRDDVMQSIRAYERRLKKMLDENNVSDGDYGWLNPDGKFFESGWGDHEKWANEYMEKHYPNQDIYYAGDFLKKNGWILLHNPYNRYGHADVLSDDIQSATNKQKEFLYDYFLERGMALEANAIYKEE